MYEIDISKWKVDVTFFVETHSFWAMLDTIRKQSYVTFVGVPGSGKTFTARHIALTLQEEEGYNILPIKDIKDIETFCDPHNPQVFIVDDAVGVFGFDMGELEKLDRYKDRLIKPTIEKTKILMTCRETVFRNDALSDIFLSKKDNVIMLHSDEYALNDEDKHKLLFKYSLDEDLLPQYHLSHTSSMFPYICKMVSKKEEWRRYGLKFFITPVPCILEILSDMRVRNRIQYSVLVLLMINENKLSEKDFDNEDRHFNEKKREVLKMCKVSTTTDCFEFTSALNEMEGTFTQKCADKFTFGHDSMFEIVAHHFGSQFPQLILQHLSSAYIANYIKLDDRNRKRRRESESQVQETDNDIANSNTIVGEDGNFDLFIRLQEWHYPYFAERLFQDVENGDLLSVFMNEDLKRPLVLQSFLAVMKSKSYDDLKSVFLLKKKNKEKIPYDFDFKNCFGIFLFDVGGLLIENICQKCNHSLVRGISFVILNGHSEILQFVIKQIIENKGNTDDLFHPEVHEDKDSLDYALLNAYCDNVTEFFFDGKKMKRHNVLNNETDTDSVILEQLRLILLGCCSNDRLTIKTLLEYVDKNILDTSNEFREKQPYNLKKTPIVLACENGLLVIAEELLNAGSSVNMDDKFGTPLTVACNYKYLDIVKLLIERGADVNQICGSDSPLMAACRNMNRNNSERLELIEYLIKHGADVNKRIGCKYPDTPLDTTEFDVAMLLLCNDGSIVFDIEKELIIACRNGWTDDVVELINENVDVNAKEFGDRYRKKFECFRHGYIFSRPVIEACKEGHLKIVKLLLRYGADVNLEDITPDCGYKSPLHAACEGGHLDIVRELLQTIVIKYEDLEHFFTIACNKGHESVVFVLLEEIKKYVAVNANINYSLDLLEHAIRRLNVVEELLKLDIVFQETKAFVYIEHAFRFNELSVVKKIIEKTTHCICNVNSTPLLTACENGNTSEVSHLLEATSNVNEKGVFETPLTAACRHGHAAIVEMLLKMNADVNLSDCFGTPLTAACRHGNLIVVELLIKAGADVDKFSKYDSPLTAACRQNHLRIVKTLLKAGAKIDQRDYYCTPLAAAIECGNGNVVEELILMGADINLKINNKTPLTAACEYGYADVVKNIIKGRGGLTVREPNQDLLFYDYQFKTRCKNGHSNFLGEMMNMVNYNIDCAGCQFTIACRKGHLSVVKTLIQSEADVNAADIMFHSPLAAACQNGHLRVVQELIKAGNYVDNPKELCLPLNVACKHGHLDVVVELIKAKPEINMQSEKSTPLIEACANGHLNVVVELLKVGAAVNQDSGAKTPLIAACKNGCTNLVRELLNAGAKIDTQIENTTPLLTACAFGSTRVVRELINAGANVNQRIGNRTPLKNAFCDNNNNRICKELLNAGAVVVPQKHR